jgi:predicted alpha/beta-hydrolase family hydrolase
MKQTIGKILVSEQIGYVSTIALLPQDAKYLMILGHGAGADMNHPFMEGLAQALAKINIGSIRYNFPYMEKRKGRPDIPAVAHKTIAAVISEANERYGTMYTLVLGGKSFGGRMASQAMDKFKFPQVKALVFYGFPLHAPTKPGVDRADHLRNIDVPMLFLQGSKDSLARLDLIEPLVNKLPMAASVIYEGGDHSFKFGKKWGIDQQTALQMLAKDTAVFLASMNP